MSAKVRTALYAGLLSVASALWSIVGWAADPSPPADPVLSQLSHLSGPVLSPRLSDLPHARGAETPHEVPIHRPPPPARGLPSAGPAVVQTAPGPQLTVTLGSSFSGIAYNGSWPPDPNIAVGKNYIVQVANTEIEIFNKNGTIVSGPKNLSSLWSSAGAPCASSNSGDPIVQYDNLADNGNGRWLITQLGSLSAPYSECFAISQTSDPTGAYYVYSQNFGDYLNDYPKLGVWPTATNSAYLASYNLFFLGVFFAGADLCAYDRTALLSGAASPAFVCYNVSTASYLPSDLDGATAPADNTPGYFLDFPTTSSLRLYELSANFTSLSSTLTQVTPDIAVDSFSEACNGGSCIPQPQTRQRLDSLGDRLMYRLAYRMLGGTPTMVVNHSVAAGASVGIRWYELQPAGGAFGVSQSGTFAPDSAYRWMGSAAMNGAGDIALGYSVSSGSLYPEIAFTGRTPSMTPGTLGAETVLQPGFGSQTGSNRWGDYSAARIDPADDTTFWYTGQYYQATSQVNWSTIIRSFTIASGAPPPPPGVDFTLSLSPTSLTVAPSSSGSTTVTITAVSGTPSVNLSASGLPKFTSASFSSNPVTATGASILSINANHKASFSGTVTVTGSDASGSQSAPLTLTIP